MSFIITLEKYYKNLGWTLIMPNEEHIEQNEKENNSLSVEKTTKKTIDI